MHDNTRHYKESICVAGSFLYGTVCPVLPSGGKRSPKRNVTKDPQKKINQKNAEMKLTRLIEANFKPNDNSFVLTYDQTSGKTDQNTAKTKITKFLRRLRYICQKYSIELIYIYVTEYGEKGGAIHHHILLPQEIPHDVVEDLWQHGNVLRKPLYWYKDGIKGFAAYLVKGRVYYRRWNRSKNLIVPQDELYDDRLSEDDVKKLTDDIDSGTAHIWFELRHSGFEFLEAIWKKNSTNYGVYIHFTMRKKQPPKLHSSSRRQPVRSSTATLRCSSHS